MQLKIQYCPMGRVSFTGKTAIYYGNEEFYDDNAEYTLLQQMPLAICDKTAAEFAVLNREDIHISKSTFFYDGGECC